MIEGRGFDLHDLGAARERPEQVSYLKPRPAARELETREELARWIFASDGGRLRDHEQEFARNMARRLVLGGEPTPWKAEWLRRLYDKLGSAE